MHRNTSWNRGNRSGPGHSAAQKLFEPAEAAEKVFNVVDNQTTGKGLGLGGQGSSVVDCDYDWELLCVVTVPLYTILWLLWRSDISSEKSHK